MLLVTYLFFIDAQNCVLDIRLFCCLIGMNQLLRLMKASRGSLQSDFKAVILVSMTRNAPAGWKNSKTTNCKRH